MQEQLLAVDTGPLVLRDPCDECGWNANGVKAEAAAVALAQLHLGRRERIEASQALVGDQQPRAGRGV
jgi:hypothetical protein